MGKSTEEDLLRYTLAESHARNQPARERLSGGPGTPRSQDAASWDELRVEEQLASVP